jgi:hypothetical protein
MAIREQVSGPGSNSKRTDLNVSKQPQRYMSGGSYGEGQELLSLQQGADMAGLPTPSGTPSVNMNRGSSQPIVNLTAATQRPNEPMTSGADFGAGPGSEILNLPAMPGPKTLINVLEELIPYDTTGQVSAIYNYLNNENQGV